jgi:hypothetical protein
MYEMVFGDGQSGLAILGALGFTKVSDVGRYRSCWIERDEDGALRAAVYTRNGGGNRECWADQSEVPDGEQCACTGCIQTRVLPMHQGYLFDRDDEFDSTYCTNYFSLPDDLAERIERMVKDGGAEVQAPVDMSERWQEAIKAIGAGPAE